MNLAAVLLIQAGGLGSGCKGDDCGRPPSRVAKAKIENWIGKRDVLWREATKKLDDSAMEALETLDTPTTMDPRLARSMSYQREQVLSFLVPAYKGLENELGMKDSKIEEVNKWWAQSQNEYQNQEYQSAIASQEIALSTMHQALLHELEK